MKTTIVPAQVTTVEDKVAGNLSFMQMVLLAVPVFGGSLLYAALPPSMEVALYKLLSIGIITLFCLLLAVRIKGKIILLWCVVLIRYRSRPRLYVLEKNTPLYREPVVSRQQKAADVTTLSTTSASLPAEMDIQTVGNGAPLMSVQERAIAQQTMINPLSRVRFNTTKNGGLHVQLSETSK